MRIGHHLARQAPSPCTLPLSPFCCFETHRSRAIRWSLPNVVFSKYRRGFMDGAAKENLMPPAELVGTFERAACWLLSIFLLFLFLPFLRTCLLYFGHAIAKASTLCGPDNGPGTRSNYQSHEKAMNERWVKCTTLWFKPVRCLLAVPVETCMALIR